MILKQGHNYEPMPHDGKVIRRIYRGGRCYYIASPYSPEATQALKAAFPQYWTAIRDYGLANPALVPFINEDPMLICSLVEVGKTRWLVGDGKAYVLTNVEVRNTIGFNVYAVSRRIGTNTFVYGGNTSGRLGISYYNGENNYVLHYNSTYHIKNNYPAQSVPHLFSHNVQNGKFLIDGQQYDSWTWSSNPSGATFGIFATNIGAEQAMVDIQFVEFVDNQTTDQVAHFIPMQRTDGTCGMLDIVSLTFHPNANTEGAFTIQVTDKAT